MTISNEAVEAAARAIYEQNPCGEQDFDADFRPTGPGYVIRFDELCEYDASLYELSISQGRAALEAAAPHMLQANEGMAATAQGNVMDRPVEIISENPDVCFIEAALSWYDGGPAGDDVRQSWSRLKDIIHAPHLYPASGEVGERLNSILSDPTYDGSTIHLSCEEAAAVLSALSEATERAGRMEREATRLKEKLGDAEAKVKELLGLLAPFLPIDARDTPDYAVLSFGDHQTQAMTMQPDDWIALSDAALRWTEEASQGEKTNG